MTAAEIIRSLIDRLHPAPMAQIVEHPGGRVLLHHRDWAIETPPGAQWWTPAHLFAAPDDLAAWIDREVDVGRWMADETTMLVGPDQIMVTGEVAAARPPAKVACELRPHPHRVGWGKISGQAMPPRAMVGALRPLVADVADGDKLLAEVSSLTLRRGETVHAEIAETGLEVARRRGKTATIDQPITPQWTARIPWYAALPEIAPEVALQVSLADDDGELRIRIDLLDEAVAGLAAVGAMVEHMRAIVESPILIGVGSAQHAHGRFD